ncbi:PH domain-containing protein [Carboxydothermus ferrireducens]|nr:PH domain-containing protein [Carboxydothermus ferrireducens]
MYFPSKKSVIFGGLMWGGLTIGLIAVISEMDWVGTVIISISLVFWGWVWFSTGYKIDENFLVIKSGPIKAKIPIKEITKIYKTRNPVSSAALSLDRLAIVFGKNYDEVIISPVDEDKFINELRKINSKIIVAK